MHAEFRQRWCQHTPFVGISTATAMRGRRPTDGSGVPFPISSHRRAPRRQIATVDAASGCRRSGAGCRSPRALQAAPADRAKWLRTIRAAPRARGTRHPRRRRANIDRGRAGQTARKRDLRPTSPPRCESTEGSAAIVPARSVSAFAFYASDGGRRIADQHTALRVPHQVQQEKPLPEQASKSERRGDRTPCGFGESTGLHICRSRVRAASAPKRRDSTRRWTLARRRPKPGNPGLRRNCI